MNELAADASRTLVDQGVARQDVRLVRELDMRYRGQSFDITVPYGDDTGAVIASFHRRHERRYGYAAYDELVEIATVRVLAAGMPQSRPPSTIQPLATNTADERSDPIEAIVARRDVYDGTRYTSTPVYARERLHPGDAFAGPAIVEQYDTTPWLPPGWSCRVEPQRNLVLER